MLDKEYNEFRVIPGYEGYCVNRHGVIKSIERNHIMWQSMLNGYVIVDTFRGSLTETLPVHRAVALAWVDNPNPDKFTVVNHLDGIRHHNYYKNLEWTSYSGNSYHAVNIGLRSDNIRCKVRNFETREISEFASIAQAAEFMGLRKDTPITSLLLKKFGSLIENKFEFRFEDDPTPWFYDTRSRRVGPSRYMVEVRNLEGELISEVYSTSGMLKKYQLYDSPDGVSMSALVKHANNKLSHLRFRLRDSYHEVKFRVNCPHEKKDPFRITASKDGEILEFDSLTKAAKYFNVCRSSIKRRYDSKLDLDGWLLIKQDV